MSSFLVALATGVALAKLLQVSAQVQTAPVLQPWPLDIPSVGHCCNELGGPAELLSCANESAYAVAPDKVGLLTFVTPKGISDIWKFASYQVALMTVYAEHNRYTFRLSTEADTLGGEGEPESDVRWNKIKLLRRALDPLTGWARRLDYIVWIDADAIVLDLSMRIELISEQHPGADIIASSDIRQGYINSGFLLLRNSEWTRKFLARWWGAVDRSLLCDQDAFDVAYSQLAAEERAAASALPHVDRILLKDRIRILARDALNSDPPATIRQQPHNQVLHLMGESSDLRAAAFREAWENICQSHGSGSLLQAQLGLTRRRLKALALESYRKSVSELFQSSSVFEDSFGPPLALNNLSELSRTAHHLCDLLLDQWEKGQNSHGRSSLQESPELVEVVSLRTKVFDLTRRWVNIVRSQVLMEQASGKIESKFLSHALVELLKRAAEAGNDLYGVSLRVDERRAAAAIVFVLLDELRDRLAPESRPVALHMTALMHQNLGILDWEIFQEKQNDEKMLRQSRKSFEVSVKFFEEAYPPSHPADRSSSLEHLHSLQLLAAVACTQGDFPYGLAKWKSTLEKAEALMAGVRLGRPLEMLAEATFNAALCNRQAGELLFAASLGMKAVQLAEAVGAESPLLQASRALVAQLQTTESSTTQLPQQAEDDERVGSPHDDDWEECAEGEIGCEAFQVDEEDEESSSVRAQYARLSSRFTANVDRGRETVATIAQAVEEREYVDEDDIEIRRHYARQTGRFQRRHPLEDPDGAGTEATSAKVERVEDDAESKSLRAQYARLASRFTVSSNQLKPRH